VLEQAEKIDEDIWLIGQIREMSRKEGQETYFYVD
jgi:hypothetical protein